MNVVKYVFVILHYVVVNETINCIRSIQTAFSEEKSYRIVVVDNGSPNNSGKELYEKYKNDRFVVVLINKENLGFAKGNNIGYKYAKDVFSPDYIIVMNNDVEISDRFFLKKIEEIYCKEPYHVLGPDIYSSSFEAHQSPKQCSHYSYREIVKANKSYESMLRHPLWVRFKCIFKRSYWLRRVKYQHNRKKVDSGLWYRNVPLHGACLVFSRSYIQFNDEAFFPDTFFYYESEILDYLCLKNEWKTIYCPDIKVVHHQNVATNVAYKDMFSKTMFALRCNRDSSKVLLQLMEADKD